jgi:hypothetical protein
MRRERISFGFDDAALCEAISDLHAETPVDAGTQHVFLQRISGTGAYPNVLGLCA